MLATVVYANNPFDPARDRNQVQVRRRHSLQKYVPKTTLPFICLVNGVPVLRANNGWQRKISDGDVVAFITLPQGGGGSNPLRIILMVGLAIAAPGLGSSLVGENLAAVEAFGGMTYASLASSIIGFVGNALINALIPPPKPTSSSQAQSSAAASPTYNLNAQGNSARIGQAIPVLYGQHLIYPDFAAEPYTEYAGNEQYLYQLFCIGQGQYDVSNIKIEDTDIANFAEVTYEVVSPGALVTLFPSNVITANEVSGQELLTNVAVGAFMTTPAGIQTNFIAVDIVAPRGLYYANDAGGLSNVGVAFKVEARMVNDAGTPIGSWGILGSETINAATGTPQRRSFKYTVAKARYEVKVTRTDIKQTDSRYGHEIDWVSLRAYIPDSQNYGDLTMLAVRMRATNNISSQSARRINCIAQRKLPVWNGTTWSAPTATRSICWALADALRASYGGNIADSRIDLAQLLALDATLAARGDTFDGIFDQKQVLWEALTLIARAGRIKPYVQGGMYHFTRDGAVTLPVALFSQRNIVKNSLKVEYLLPSDETADSVMVTYFDAAKQKPLEILAQLPGYSSDNPYPIDLFGVTNADHAWREGRYIAAANRYRRQSISFTTEMEVFIPTFGDLIAIAHDRMQRNVAGDVLGYNAGTKILTLSEPVTFAAGNHYFGFKLRDGSFSGPWLATAGVDEYHPVLSLPLDFTPDTDTTREKTTFTFGKGEEYRKLARVISVRPRSIHQVEILCVNEDPAVHTADTGITPPPSSYWNLPAKITRPLVTGLSVTLSGTPSNPQLAIDWIPAAGADHYYVETSYDNGASWQRRGEVSSANTLVAAQRGTVYVRVAGVGLSQGDWVQWIGNPYAVPPPDVSSLLVSRQSDGTRQFDWALSSAPPPDLAGYQIRYRTGTNVAWGWADLSPAHDGILTSSPWETNQLTAGQYTFAIKAIDDSGIESANAAFVIADLGNPRLAGVLVSVLPHTQGWPGTKTGCHVEDGSLVANSTATWDSITSWNSWTAWNNSPVSPIYYEPPVIDVGGVLPFTPIVDVIANGTVLVQESHSNDNVTYTSWATAGSLISARYVKVRITVTSAGIASIDLANIKLSAESISEEINDLSTSSLSGAYRIGVGDIRLPKAKAYSLITQVQVSLQNVGAGWSWELIDKSTTTGPRIKIYNASNALADASIDAFIRGA